MNIKNLKSKLQHISTESTKDFLYLSESFPILIKEIDFSNTASNSRTQKELDEINRTQKELFRVVEAQHEVQKHNQAFLNRLNQRNADLLASFTSRMDFFNNMNEVVYKIKDSSMEMEIISLNAMIVSIKSGKEGQAFSYITSNLKTLSYQLIAEADALMKNEQAVQAGIEDLKKMIDNAGDASSDSEKFNKNTGEVLSSILNEMMTELPALIDFAGTAMGPIVNAMECIQIQDIIRQSIDGILYTINFIEEPAEKCDAETKLDQYTFNKQLASAGAHMLESVIAKLQLSVDTFKENKAKIKDILSEIEQRQSAINKMYITDESSTKNLQKHITTVSEEIHDFTQLVVTYQNAQQLIVKQSALIHSISLKMRNRFTEFFTIIENLEYVAVAQRIEVARNEAISSIHSTVEYMSNLIAKTNDQVYEAQEHLKQFIDKSTAEIQDFTELGIQDKIVFKDLEEEKKEIIDSFTHLHKKYISIIEDFVIYSDDFFVTYNGIEKTIEHIETFIPTIKTVQEELRFIANTYEKKTPSLLTELGLSEWVIHNDRFKDILKEYTIVDDKHTLGSLTGVDVAEGVESGDITFF